VSGRSIRDAWLADVLLRPRLGDACRRLLLLYAVAEDGRGPWMSASGRIRPIKHRVAGDVLGMTEKTVANHILEATKQGFLLKDPTTGYRGRPAAYQATLPAKTGVVEGPVSLRSLLDGVLKVPGHGEPSSPGIREPFPPSEDTKVPGFGEAQRAQARTRVPKNNRESQPASLGNRVERDHASGFKPAATGEWQPTPSKRPSFDSTRNVA
jgi:hypothetical protein